MPLQSKTIVSIHFLSSQFNKTYNSALILFSRPVITLLTHTLHSFEILISGFLIGYGETNVIHAQQQKLLRNTKLWSRSKHRSLVPVSQLRVFEECRSLETAKELQNGLLHTYSVEFRKRGEERNHKL